MIRFNPSNAAKRYLFPIGVLAVVIIATVLRLWEFHQPAIADELAWLHPGFSAVEIALSRETAINPPLLQILFNAPLSAAGALWWGRAWSLAASVLAVVGMAWLARAARDGNTDGATEGIFAALLLALMPIAIQQGGIYRAYATGTLLLIWHYWALVVWAKARDTASPGQIAAVVISAILLVQVHYFTAFQLLFEGLLLAAWGRRWRTLLLYGPAALLLLPWIYVAVGGSEARLPASSPSEWLSRVYNTLGLGLDQPRALMLVIAVVLVWAAVLWPRLEVGQRVLWIASVAAMLAGLVVPLGHLPRTDTTVFVTPALFALVATMPASYPMPLEMRTGIWLALFYGWCNTAFDRYEYESILGATPDQGYVNFVEDYQAGQWASERIYVHPAQAILQMHWELFGEPWSCCEREGRLCFDDPATSTRFIGANDPQLPPTDAGIVVTIWPDRVAPLLESCTTVHSEPGLGVWLCGDPE